MTTDEPPFDPDYDQPGPSAHAPPHDYDAERAVLACLLTDPTLAATLASHLAGDDFYRPNHEHIWNALQKLAADGTPPDPVLLNSQLLQQGRVDVARELPELLTTSANTALAEHYAKVVRDQSRLRVALTAGTKLRDLAIRGQVGMIDHYLGDALQEIETATLRWGPTDRSAGAGLADLSWILHGEPPPQPQPAWARRTDGTALFYPGKVNGIFGDPEAAKTWLAQCAIVEALHADGTAAMIDVDHNGQNHTAARLLLLGATLDQLADPNRFRYYEPEDADQLRAAVDDITTRAPTVVLIDSLGEIFPMLGVSTNDGDEMSTAMRQVCTRPANAGSCVITIDHLPKSTDARATGFAIGSIAKKRMVRGAYLRAEARVQPAPGQVGRITLRIEKDTIGELRRSSGGGYAGTFTLDSRQDHITTWSISRDDSPVTADGRFRPTKYMELVSKYVEENDQATGREIEEGVGGAAKHIRTALKLLIAEGFISTMAGARRSTLHHSIAMYREAEDDQA